MECGVGGQPHKTPLFLSPTPAPTPSEWPSQEQPGSGVTPLYRCRTFPLLLVQMGYGLLCGLWVWRRRTNRGPCRPPMSNPSTSWWTARPESSGQWDNRMAAQHLPRDLARPSIGYEELAQKKKKSRNGQLHLGRCLSQGSRSVVWHAQTLWQHHASQVCRCGATVEHSNRHAHALCLV